MKLLFVHDVKAQIYDHNIYARSYGYKDVWQERYLTIFDEIIVCCRTAVSSTDLEGKMDKSSGPYVDFDTRVGMFKGPEIFFSHRIKQILREDIRKVDYVIVRLDSFLGLQAIKECQRMRRPYTIELVGCAWDSFWNHGLSGKVLAPYLFFRTRKEVRNAPYVIYVTSEFLQKRYPTKGKNTNISNVKISSVDEAVLEKRIRKIESMEKSYIIHLGTAANVNIKYKGQQYVIRALAKLKQEGFTNYVYELAGAGDNSYLKNLAIKLGVEDQVIFKGSLTHEQIFDWLDNSVDIYIQPSLQEGLPRSVIEAMSRGCLCLGAKTAGIPELLDNQFVFKRKSVKGIKSILLSLTQESLLNASEKNFWKSAEYLETRLNKKRSDFYNMAKGETIKRLGVVND